MHGSAKKRAQSHNVLVGAGESSFYQLPCAQAVQSSKMIQISCGATAAVALVVAPVADSEHDASQILEWGTGLYGERLLSDKTLPPTVPLVGTSGTATPSEPIAAAAAPLNHPMVVSPWVSRFLSGTHRKTIRSIACGAHFVVAAIVAGGCISWGGGRESTRILGRGGCGNCLSASCICGSGSATLPSSCAGEPDWVAEPLGSRGVSVIDLAAGDDHTVAVCADGSAWAWGRGDCGQLGIGPPTTCGGDGGACRPTRVRMPTPVKESSTAAAAAAAAAATTAPAVAIAATVNSSNEARRSSVARAVACGRDHSAILASDGRLLTFGSGLHGQLGLGTVGNMAWTPTAVDALEGVGTMRTDGSFTGIASVACGAWHTAALSTTGDVYTWGWARFGALGPSLGDEPACLKADDDGGMKRDSDSRGKGNAASSTEERAEVRPYPGPVEGVESLLLEDDRIVSVNCGARYTLALSLNKRAFVWGQVAPSADGGAAGFGPRCSHLVSSNIPSDSFCHPREIRPSELWCAAAASRSKGESEGVSCWGDGHGKDGGGTLSVEGSGTVESDESRWRVSSVGCGPWYIVFGIEKEGRGGDGEQAL